jgi:hypothetical protein
MAVGRHPMVLFSRPPGPSALPLGRRPGFLLTVATAEEDLAPRQPPMLQKAPPIQRKPMLIYVIC